MGSRSALSQESRRVAVAFEVGKATNDQKRCAIYTRKSTTAGLSQEWNTLHNQREICSAYIKCQAHKNWVELPQLYDDGGFSGGSLERPALKRLIDDIAAGRIDMVVVYKIDRLSRSLGDFIRLIDTLGKYGASFVSVTQTFDTSDSMGRLVLNILLTFAQFERELASDRTRDKKAALMRRGLYIGGTPPFGYLLAKGGKLDLDPERATLVREMFDRFPNVPAQRLSREFKERGLTTRRFVSNAGIERGGHPIYTNHILKILSNPIYVGHIVHRGDWIKAEIEPLTTREQWDLVQKVKQERFPHNRDPVRNFLLDILHDEQGRRMRIQRGTGRSSADRYYRSEYTSWSRDGVTRRVMVCADRTEALTVSALEAFLVDRIQLKAAILSLGLYSDEIRRMLRMGHTAAKRLRRMDRPQLRALLLALTPRLEVNTSGAELYVSCYELSRFLAWDGAGVFQKAELKPARVADPFHVVKASAFLICGHPQFALPIDACKDQLASPKPWLVELLAEAAALRQFMLANRTKSIAELAREKRIGPSTFARMLRVNYLAPDTQAAIIDGTQPESLTQYKILKGPMPLDWEQQRRLLGFV
jgi:DNA invertase Pin-like site-specific DNA recombinase